MCPYLINIVNIFQYSSLFATVIAPSYRIQIITSISQQRRCIITPRPTILVIFTQLLSIVAYLKNGTAINPRATRHAPPRHRRRHYRVHHPSSSS